MLTFSERSQAFNLMSFSGVFLNHFCDIWCSHLNPLPPPRGQHTQNNYPLLVTNCQSTCQRQTMQLSLCKNKQHQLQEAKHKMLIISIREPLSTDTVGGWNAPPPQSPPPAPLKIPRSVNCRGALLEGGGVADMTSDLRVTNTSLRWC